MAEQIWKIGDFTLMNLIETEEFEHFSAGALGFLAGADASAVAKLEWPRRGWIDSDGKISWSNQSFLLEANGRRYIIDTCVGNNKPRRLDYNVLETDFLHRLSAIWDPRTINGVICTHLHVDHVGWNTRLEKGEWVPTFPNAEYFFVHSEFNHWQDFLSDPHAEDIYPDEFFRDNVDGKAVFTDSVLPVLEAGQAVLIPADAEIAPGIRLIPSGGHTPGHASIEIESGGEVAAITGDLLHSPFQVTFPEWSSPLDTDMAESAISRIELLKRWENSGALVLGTHFGGKTAGRIIREGSRLGLS